MSDEDVKEAQNTEVEETTQSESPTGEESNDSSKPEDKGNAEDVSTSKEAQEEPVEEPENTESKRDRSAEGRIKELIDKNKNLTQQQQRQFAESTPQQQKKFTDYLQGRNDISPEELNQVANQYLADVQGNLMQQTDSLVNLRLQEREARQRLENEANQVSELEIVKENPEVEGLILETWQKQANAQFDQNGNLISFNPNVSLAEVANKQAEVLEKYATKGRANDKQVLSQQAEESAVTPSAKSPEPKDASDMSIKELEGKLGFAE